LIESIDWDIDLAEWRLSIGGTPVPAVSWFRIGTSALNGSDVIGF
jgi:hypothetical protein